MTSAPNHSSHQHSPPQERMFASTTETKNSTMGWNNHFVDFQTNQSSYYNHNHYYNHHHQNQSIHPITTLRGSVPTPTSGLYYRFGSREGGGYYHHPHQNTYHHHHHHQYNNHNIGSEQQDNSTQTLPYLSDYYNHHHRHHQSMVTTPIRNAESKEQTETTPRRYCSPTTINNNGSFEFEEISKLFAGNEENTKQNDHVNNNTGEQLSKDSSFAFASTNNSDCVSPIEVPRRSNNNNINNSARLNHNIMDENGTADGSLGGLLLNHHHHDFSLVDSDRQSPYLQFPPWNREVDLLLHNGGGGGGNDGDNNNNNKKNDGTTNAVDNGDDNNNTTTTTTTTTTTGGSKWPATNQDYHHTSPVNHNHQRHHHQAPSSNNQGNNNNNNSVRQPNSKRYNETNGNRLLLNRHDRKSKANVIVRSLPAPPKSKMKTRSSNKRTKEIVMVPTFSSSSSSLPLPASSSRQRLHGGGPSRKWVPSQAEIDDARTDRGKQALQTWYKRLNELQAFKDVHRHCK